MVYEECPLKVEGLNLVRFGPDIRSYQIDTAFCRTLVSRGSENMYKVQAPSNSLFIGYYLSSFYGGRNTAYY